MSNYTLTDLHDHFHEALRLKGTARDAFLDDLETRSSSLKQEVLDLLAAEDRAGDFMAGPTIDDFDDGLTRKIGPYVLVKELGEGGCGTVYLAQQQQPVKREVALKVIKLGMDTKAVIARFDVERQALALMDHPNIARVLEAGSTATGRPYFVMELVQGVPVTIFCESEDLGLSDRLKIFMVICQAVHHAHQKGVIHRDLKPSNILVSQPDGCPAPKVIDFGIAKATGNEMLNFPSLTQQQPFIGTPAYMSPEQVANSGQDIDTRSDIYSLGVLLYELLTGTTPLRAVGGDTTSYEAMRHSLLEKEPPPPSSQSKFRRHVRGELDWIVMKALAKDRDYRYDSAAALANEVNRYLSDKPVEAGPPSVIYRFQKSFKRWRRNQAVATLTCLAVLLLAAGTVSVLWQWRRAENLVLSEGENRRRADAMVQELTLQRAEDLLQEDEAHEGLVYLAKALRADPANREIRERLISVLTFRSFALSQFPPLRHEGPVSSVVWSPDGMTIVTASSAGEVQLWDALSGQARGAKLVHEAPVTDLAFDSEGRRLLVVTRESVRIHDLKTGTEYILRARLAQPVHGAAWVDEGEQVIVFGRENARVFDSQLGARLDTHPILHSTRITDADVSSDGTRLVTGTKGGSVRVWSLPSGEKLAGPFTHNGLKSVAFHRNGSRLIAGGYGNRGRIWNIDSHQEEDWSLSHEDVVEHVSFSPEGTLALTCSRDGIAQLWNQTTGEKQGPPLRHRGQVTHAVFSPDGIRLLTFGTADTAYLWNTLDGRLLVEPIRLPHAVTSGAFHPEGHSLVLGCHDGSAYVLDIRPGQALPLSFGKAIYAADWSPDSARVATAGRDGRVQVWDSRSGHTLELKEMKHAGWVIDIAFGPDGTRLATGAVDGTATIWNAGTGEVLASVRHDGRVSAVEFSPDGRLLATASFDHTARVWEVDTGEPILTAPFQHRSRVWFARFSPDGQRLATCSSDDTARVWDLSNGQPVTPSFLHDDDARRLVFHPSSLSLFTGSDDLSVSRWDITSVTTPCWRTHHRGPISQLDVSPDGQRLLSSSIDGTAMIWHAETGEPLTEPLQHAHQLSDAAFSPGGDRVATSSFDKTVRLWDGRTGKPISEAIHHEDRVLSVKFSADEKSLMTLTEDGRVHIWPLPRSSSPATRLLNLAEALTNYPRALTPTSRFADSWLEWFLSDRSERPMTPHTSISTSTYVERLLQDGRTSQLETALRLVPRRPAALVKLGQSYLSQHKRLQAERCAKLALLQQPVDHVDAHFLLARVHQANGDFYKAKATLRDTGEFSERHADTPETCIDLSGHYLAAIRPNSDTNKLSSGLHEFDRVVYDIRGYVQVSRNRNGICLDRSGQIPVEAPCRRLHLLHATTLSPGRHMHKAEIARYVINYKNGESEELPLIFGQHLHHWLEEAGDVSHLTDGNVVWTGTSSSGKHARLFHSVWENPSPNNPVASFEMIATYEKASPFLVALTRE